MKEKTLDHLYNYTKYAQCDYLLVKQEHIRTILDCEVKMEAAKDSDHYQIYGKIQTNMKLGKKKDEEENKAMKYWKPEEERKR